MLSLSQRVHSGIVFSAACTHVTVTTTGSYFLEPNPPPLDIEKKQASGEQSEKIMRTESEPSENRVRIE